ncbi:hypothetical protein NCCP28_34150 [Niallia sp. NCCP-28]|nr:hypothetical protein NCCP28_34150 [Niallia sp. NCCP-28]
MYRPTIRCSDAYKDYINNLFQRTELDRNQIIRAALFTAAHSELFQKLMDAHKKRDVTLPPLPWSVNDNHLWMEQDPEIKREERDVNANQTGGIEVKINHGIIERNRRGSAEREEQGQTREIRKRGGGIFIQIGTRNKSC